MWKYWWSVLLGLCIACGAYAEIEWMGRVYLCPISGQCRDRVYPCPTGGQPQGLSLQTGGKGWFDSLNVRFVGNWPFGPSDAVAVDPARALAFCGSGGGVFILDLTTPANPTRISDGVRTRGSVRGLFYDEPNKRLYIAAEEAGLEIWDITTPSAPYRLGSHDTPHWARDVSVQGSYAYIADWYTGLRIIDISNPTEPTEVGFYDTPGLAGAVAVLGSYAYIADWGAGLRIIDIRNPAEPTEVGFYDTPGGACGVAIEGSYAYIADAHAGLRIIDISNPASPTEVGFYDTPGWACGVAVEASYAYIADDWCGLQIYENLLVGIEEDENYELGIMNYELTVHPNPFMQETVIKFTVHGSQFTGKNRQLSTVNCQLKIYDVAGGVVQSLVDGKVKPGHHTVRFDGRNLASGIYFARLKAGDYRETKKMILLR